LSISFDEFKKIEMKVGKIVDCQPHPNADKLYVLTIDVGDGEKRSVAGLRPYYSPEELVGKIVVVVTNLEPATLRGVESQVMLLAAQDGDVVALLQPDREVKPGSKIL